METMTTREFLEAVKVSEVSEEIKGEATRRIEKLDAANAKRKSAPKKVSAAHVQNAELADQLIKEFLTKEPKSASEVAEFLDVKVQKASAVLRQAEKEGRIAVEEVKVKGKGKVKGYSLLD